VTPPHFTIGHSTRSLAEFTGLLTGAQVQLLVDIRRIPRSRANPQFNADELPDALAPSGIGYVHLAGLGGLRGAVPGVSAAVNAWWTNERFHHYADYALTAPFREAFARLLALGCDQRSAIMCSEAVWWRCHRRIVADYLLGAGRNVLHIMGQARVEPAVLSPGARVQGDGTIVYPGVSRLAPLALQ